MRPLRDWGDLQRELGHRSLILHRWGLKPLRLPDQFTFLWQRKVERRQENRQGDFDAHLRKFKTTGEVLDRNLGKSRVAGH